MKQFAENRTIEGQKWLKTAKKMQKTEKKWDASITINDQRIQST
jgi:hypothetical protein